MIRKIIISWIAATSLILFSTQAFALINFSVGVPLSHSMTGKGVSGDDIESEGVFFVDPDLGGGYEIQRYTDDTNNDSFDNMSLTLEGTVGDLEVIYAGAYTQVMFGIKGKRWNIDGNPHRSYWNDFWTWPDESEVPINAAKVENGCYWK